MKRLFGMLALATLAATVRATVSNAATSKRPETKVAVAVTSNGFEPAIIKVEVGQPVRLVVTRKVERTCATEVVLKDFGIKRALPLNQPVEIRFVPKKAGSIRYACAMNMIAGELIVR